MELMEGQRVKEKETEDCLLPRRHLKQGFQGGRCARLSQVALVCPDR